MRATKMKILTIGICALLMAGCDDLGMTVSLHPIAKEEQPQFEPALLGRWQSENGDYVLLFEKTEAGAFRLLVFDHSSLEADPEAAPEERYAVQSMRLGRFVFLDMTAPPGSDDFLKIPVHIFARLDLSEDQFEIAFLSDDWLKAALEQKRSDVPHEMVDGQVVLTAKPQELRQFLERNAWDDEAFPPDGRYRRLAGQ